MSLAKTKQNFRHIMQSTLWAMTGGQIWKRHRKQFAKPFILKENQLQERNRHRNSKNKQVIDDLVIPQKFATTVWSVPFLCYSNSKIVTATCNADELKIWNRWFEPSWQVTAMNHAGCNIRPCWSACIRGACRSARHSWQERRPVRCCRSACCSNSYQNRALT